MATAARDNGGKREGCIRGELYFYQHTGKAGCLPGSGKGRHGGNLELGHLRRDIL